VARSRSVYICRECGARQPRWLGRCPACQAWDALDEEPAGGRRGGAAAASSGAAGFGGAGAEWLGAAPAGVALPAARPLAEVETTGAPRMPSGEDELDRVLGGGLVPGSTVLLGGEPGVGKSTLALQLAARVAGSGRAVLYVTGEEAAEQLRLRADRLSEPSGDVGVLCETRVEALAGAWRDTAPALVVVDSIQTMRCEQVESAPGAVAQVRESAALLAAAARASGSALLLVGHVTKEGALAGPRVLEHLVDAVLLLEGDRHHAFRLLRAAKNRYGSTREVGVFSMGEAGLEAVRNPSELFLAERRPGAPGSCIVPLLEGTRPMLVEIQALVAPAPYGTPRRTALGVEDGRLALLLAVLDRRTDVDLLSRDVYVNAVGGVRVGEPGADLAVALAIASSRLDLPVPEDLVACGEVGLGGEVRRVARLDLRVREAARLGFGRVLVPRGTRAEPPGGGCHCVEVADVREALARLREGARPAKA